MFDIIAKCFVVVHRKTKPQAFPFGNIHDNFSCFVIPLCLCLYTYGNMHYSHYTHRHGCFCCYCYRPFNSKNKST